MWSVITRPLIARILKKIEPQDEIASSILEQILNLRESFEFSL